MELEKQVCSLELAKRLKKLGVKQDSLFYWDSHCIENLKTQGKYGITSDGEYSAFTVAELGVMMPFIITRNKSIVRKFTNKNVYIYEVQYSDINQSNIFLEDTEADARAKMLIYLLEKRLVKLKKT
ncbi:hypothetical protein EOM09_03625 [bacterium]|nr:hypothetical protein [bacterium]